MIIYTKYNLILILLSFFNRSKHNITINRQTNIHNNKHNIMLIIMFILTYVVFLFF